MNAIKSQIRFMAYKAKSRDDNYMDWLKSNKAVPINILILREIPYLTDPLVTDMDVLSLPTVFRVLPHQYDRYLNFIGQCHMTYKTIKQHQIIHIL